MHTHIGGRISSLSCKSCVCCCNSLVMFDCVCVCVCCWSLVRCYHDNCLLRLCCLLPWWREIVHHSIFQCPSLSATFLRMFCLECVLPNKFCYPFLLRQWQRPHILFCCTAERKQPQVIIRLLQNNKTHLDCDQFFFKATTKAKTKAKNKNKNTAKPWSRREGIILPNKMVI